MSIQRRTTHQIDTAADVGSGLKARLSRTEDGNAHYSTTNFFISFPSLILLLGNS
jgi:hypothetical protein